MSHPEPPQSRTGGTTSRIASKQARTARGRLYGKHAHTSPRQLSRLKSLRNWVEVEMPRTPEKSKGLSVLNKIIDAESQSHKAQS
jgi:hypothetical protein